MPDDTAGQVEIPLTDWLNSMCSKTSTRTSIAKPFLATIEGDSLTPEASAVPRHWRKKPVVIEATQWFKHGDHPLDYHGRPEARAQGSEGAVVRYSRRPDVPGDSSCKQCARPMDDHGWIDTLEGGHIVCPGDWIITGVQGERYPCKPDIFAATYEPAENASVAQQPDDGATREAEATTDDPYTYTAMRRAIDAVDRALPAGTARTIADIAAWNATTFLRAGLAALSQRPRAETPTGDTFDVSRMRTYLAAGNHVDAMAEYAALLGMCFEQHTKLRAAADRHNLALGDAHVADVVIAALDRLSAAPRVPEAGSAPLPNEDDKRDALLRIANLALDNSTGPAVPDVLWEIREIAVATLISEPSASTTGEADRE